MPASCNGICIIKQLHRDAHRPNCILMSLQQQYIFVLLLMCCTIPVFSSRPPWGSLATVALSSYSSVSAQCSVQAGSMESDMCVAQRRDAGDMADRDKYMHLCSSARQTANQVQVLEVSHALQVHPHMALFCLKSRPEPQVVAKGKNCPHGPAYQLTWGHLDNFAQADCRDFLAI